MYPLRRRPLAFLRGGRRRSGVGASAASQVPARGLRFGPGPTFGAAPRVGTNHIMRIGGQRGERVAVATQPMVEPAQRDLLVRLRGVGNGEFTEFAPSPDRFMVAVFAGAYDDFLPAPCASGSASRQCSASTSESWTVWSPQVFTIIAGMRKRLSSPRYT